MTKEFGFRDETRRVGTVGTIFATTFLMFKGLNVEILLASIDSTSQDWGDILRRDRGLRNAYRRILSRRIFAITVAYFT